MPACHGGLKKMSSSTTKSGRLLYCSETVFLGKIFPKLMVMGHFAPQMRLHPKEQKICPTPFGPLKQGLGLSKLLEKDDTTNDK